MVDPTDADKIDDILSRAEVDITRARGKANVGDVTSVGDETTALGSSALASLVLGWLPGAYNLQMGGAARRYFKVALEDRPTNANIEALVEYMSDPKEFLAGIEKLKTPEAQTKFMLTKLVGAAQAAAILGGE